MYISQLVAVCTRLSMLLVVVYNDIRGLTPTRGTEGSFNNKRFMICGDFIIVETGSTLLQHRKI